MVCSAGKVVVRLRSMNYLRGKSKPFIVIQYKSEEEITLQLYGVRSPVRTGRRLRRAVCGRTCEQENRINAPVLCSISSKSATSIKGKGGDSGDKSVLLLHNSWELARITVTLSLNLGSLIVRSSRNNIRRVWENDCDTKC